MASDLREVPLLAHTHGQPATPTTMGKELAVLAYRLDRQLRRVEAAEYLGKLNGATGTFGAHVAAVPEADWPEVSRDVRRVPRPDLEPPHHPDREPRLAGRALRRRRPVQPGAAQPLHRRVDLHLDRLLRAGARPGHGRVVDDAAQGQPDPLRERRGQPRGQQRPARRARLDPRDEPPAARPHRLLDAAQHRRRPSATRCSRIDNVPRGLDGLDAVPAAMAADLDANWEVLGEPVQSAMRALGAQGVPGMDNPYERLKELTRGRRITGEDLREFVAGLGLPDDVAERLSAMTPATYVGRLPRSSTTSTSTCRREPRRQQRVGARRYAAAAPCRARLTAAPASPPRPPHRRAGPRAMRTWASTGSALPFSSSAPSGSVTASGSSARVAGPMATPPTGRLALEPRGDVDRVADDRVGAPATGTEQAEGDLAAVDADAEARPPGVLRRHLGGGLLQGQGRPPPRAWRGPAGHRDG